MVMTNIDFLSEHGPKPSHTLSLDKVVGKFGVIQEVDEIKEPPGTPQMFPHYAVTVANTHPLSSDGVDHERAGATGMTVSEAKQRAFGEAVERYCLSIFNKETMSIGYARKDSDRVAPEVFNKFQSPLEKREYYWVSVYDLIADETVSIPAHLVYHPFIPLNGYIRNTITTGAAAHTTYRDATQGALLEAIERDQYIISYLNELENPVIDERWLTRTQEEIIANFSKHHFDVELYYLTVDAPIHVVLVALQDEWNDVYEFGLSAGFEMESTITDALVESYQTHTWMKRVDPNTIPPDNVNGLDARAQFWKAKDDFQGIGHWVETDSPTLSSPPSVVKEVEGLIDWFDDQSMNVYMRDLTTRDVGEANIKTVRAVIPQLHPLYLSEEYRYTGGERVVSAPVSAGFRDTRRNRNNLNPVPQPFL